jgi:hypothetical protein
MNIVVAMKQIPDLQQIRIRQRQPVGVVSTLIVELIVNSIMLSSIYYNFSQKLNYCCCCDQTGADRRNFMFCFSAQTWIKILNPS